MLIMLGTTLKLSQHLLGMLLRESGMNAYVYKACLSISLNFDLIRYWGALLKLTAIRKRILCLPVPDLKTYKLKMNLYNFSCRFV
jgi:hypothetical protein